MTLDLSAYISELLTHFSTEWVNGSNTEEIADDNDPD